MWICTKWTPSPSFFYYPGILQKIERTKKWCRDNLKRMIKEKEWKSISRMLGLSYIRIEIKEVTAQLMRLRFSLFRELWLTKDFVIKVTSCRHNLWTYKYLMKGWSHRKPFRSHALISGLFYLYMNECMTWTVSGFAFLQESILGLPLFFSFLSSSVIASVGGWVERKEGRPRSGHLTID